MRDRIAARLSGTRPSALPDEVRGIFPAPLAEAAVLVPLIERPAGLTVLFTRRSDHLRDHPGQISFPGGRLAAGETPLAAALRETAEELGVDAAAIEVAGYLPAQPVVTGFAVTPVVGFLPAALTFVPQATEVAEIFEVPLDFFLDPASLVRGTRRIGERELPVFEYRHGRHRIWGATAGILKAFVELVC